ncbi:MAG: hypothetical protein RL660_755 [Bacteroidota bacterium]|jgi:hypothetical protein
MEKVVKISKLKEGFSDYNFWKLKSDLEKLEAVEVLRKQYINYKQYADTRLQRICRVISKA